MKFTCTQENLTQGLQVVSHVAGKHVNLLVLGNILLKTDGGNLTLSATNLELGVSTVVRGKTEAEGEYTVPAKLFLDYVALLPQGKVDLVLTDEGLSITAEGQETVIRGLPASEFPLIPKLVKERPARLNVEDVRRAISQVAFAVSASESRPELSGVACFLNGISGKDTVALVATDSYRLAERVFPFSGDAEAVRCIVPARTILEIGRILQSYKDHLGLPDDVEWAMAENQLSVVYGQTELVSRLIEGSFPDYTQIIPETFKTRAIVDRADFQKAVRAAALFSRQGLYDVHLAFSPDDGCVTVRSADQGTGKTSKVVVGDVSGEQNAVTVNFKYLGDGLSAISTPKIALALNDAMSPMMVLPEGDAKETYRYLVMPIRQ